ncbi:probable ATP-dependent RNA helicase DHX58 [Haliotis rufescens]|uniref:probable ATP-dependent RNA helicase DHX58 n=1 Tax=Haliotis rufescens TaxID=6454 RepID=UPI00201F3F46|nr:probable ATP-dependent RNA helicase DHX58 [Haliotis rufescens]XP_048258539.1 probable ATP-dependent RNA helicase DHX58 [Haliotis rufescens]XP_048258540.1 probable ATP-dependent RNA helicase DHX58 [Haliotis rufescens]
MATSDQGSAKDTLEYQIELIQMCRDTFETYLDPSTILDNMNIHPKIKERIQAYQRLERQEAVKQLLDAVLADPEAHVSMFIYALKEAGFEHFTDILEDSKGPQDRNRTSAKYELLILWLQGDLKDKIIPTEIIDYLKPILSDRDYELIRNTERERSIQEACQDLFLAIQRKTPRWASYFLDALYNAYGGQLLRKIHPDLAHDVGVDDDDDDEDDEGDDDEDESDFDSQSDTDSVSYPDPDTLEENSQPEREVDPQDGKGGVARYSRDQLLSLRPRSAGPIVGADIPRECSLDADNSTPATSRHHRDLISTTIPELAETGLGEQTLRKGILPSSSHRPSSDTSEESGSDDEGQGEDVIYSRGVRMREYQLELAASAVAGLNSIIFAPTGSGKTLVAMYIAKCILEREGGKVIFLEPTVALVNQIHVEVRRYLGDAYKVLKLRGSDEDSVNLHFLLPFNDVVVMTPMILENHLKQEKIKGLSGLCRLLVLDECHHTRKGEAYNKLMIRHLREKEDGAKHLPQIVGLTAALGVEKASTEDEALDNIIRLCANLDPHPPIISTVQRNREELVRLVPVAEEETIHLGENKDSPAKKVIEEAMAKIQGTLPIVHEMHNKTIGKYLREAPLDFGSQSYNQWTVDLKAATTKVNTQGDAEQTEMIRNLSSIADHLYKYNVALTLNDLVRVKDVIDYISNELLSIYGVNLLTAHEQQLQNEASRVKKELMRCELMRTRDKENENPRLNQLVDILLGLMEDASDFRAIIFARTRATCGALADWLNNDVHVPDVLKNLNASFFTGANAGEQIGGMTQSQQDNVLSKFKSGSIKLIVATSVGNEGIDIPECNVIVAYNHTGNEITTVQVRGRSRKVGGKTVNLADDKVRERNYRNHVKEYLMKQAVDTITQIPYDRVSKLIRLFQQEALAAAEISERERQAEARQTTHVQYRIICEHCRAELTTGDMMRVINGSQYVVVDKDFTSKIRSHGPSRNRNPLKFDDVVMDGGISCEGCQKTLGSRIRVSGVVYYTLGIKHVLFLINGTEEPQKFKQWTKCPFRPRTMSQDDTLEYNRC